jgi:glycerol-3-phosphate acyltransferase PlsY
VWPTILSWVLSYLIGSISFSYLITKKIKKIDIRRFGSGNAGATNAQRVLGTGPAVVILLLDIAKGIVCVFIARALGIADWATVISGLAAIIGHDYPLYFNFKGGKGVATSVGVFFMIMWPEAIIVGILTLLIIAVTRYVSLGSLVFLLMTPALGWILGDYAPGVLAAMFAIALLSVIRHQANIVRLIHGNENKLGHKKI